MTTHYRLPQGLSDTPVDRSQSCGVAVLCNRVQSDIDLENLQWQKDARQLRII